MKIGRVFLALFAFLVIAGIASVARSTDNCDYYIQHPPSAQHPGGWGECKYNTPVPPTSVPPTDVPPPVPTDVPPTQIQPTNVPPAGVPPTGVPSTEIPATPVPPTMTLMPKPTIIGTVIFWEPTRTPPPSAFFESPEPSIDCGNTLTDNFITVWSVVGETFGWQVRINDVWYDVYACKCSTRLTTQVEYRWKFNSSTGQDEYTTFTRLTLTDIMTLNPEDYRVIDMQTGQTTGVFFSLNEHY